MKSLLVIIIGLFSLSASAKDGGREKNIRANIEVLGTKSTRTVVVKWTALNESNILSYVIEKSADGLNYNFVQSIEPANLEAIGVYSSKKININKPMYFRLRVVSNEGTVGYVNLTPVEGI
jgi:hypothetical protein